MDPFHMSLLTREELNLHAPQSLLLIPIGSTEQHGPHLAVGTDHILAAAICDRAVAQLVEEIPIVIAPTVQFGYSHHHLPFGGTLSVSPSTYLSLLMDLGESAVESGFRRIFILNGHGGNVEIAGIASRELSRKFHIPVGSGSYWTMAQERLAEARVGSMIRVPGHAGSFETSLMLALLNGSDEPVSGSPPSGEARKPLRRGSNPGRYHATLPGSWESIDGWTDDPSTASTETGMRYLDIIVEAVASQLHHFYYETTKDRLAQQDE